jgi:tagatose 1,6-diphosphate aldolase
VTTLPPGGLSAGKLWGLRRLADRHGLFRMLAVDQRPPIMNRLRALSGEARDLEVSAVKRLLVEELAPHASATLVDPVWAWPFAWDALDPQRGLLLTLESHAFADGPGGRRSASIPGWSVAKIRRMGGDAVKVLAWYRPDAAAEVRAHQEAYVRAVGAACRAHDLPFVLELLVYPFADARPGGDYLEDPAKRPELVLESVRTFADPAYGVDLFKLESPIPAERVPDPDGPESARVQPLFDALARAAGRPWVMLSAGAGPEAFRRVLVHAFRAGASGFLAGRAIWWDAFEAWPDAARMRARLRDGAVPYLEAISSLARAHATPWHRHPRFAPNGPRLARADHAFAERYPEAE